MLVGYVSSNCDHAELTVTLCDVANNVIDVMMSRATIRLSGATRSGGKFVVHTYNVKIVRQLATISRTSTRALQMCSALSVELRTDHTCIDEPRDD